MSLLSEEEELLGKKLSEYRINKLRLASVEEKKFKLREDEVRKMQAEKDIEMLERQIELLKDSIRELSKYDNIYLKVDEEFRAVLKRERDADINRASIKKEIDLTKDIINEMSADVGEKEVVKRKLNKLLEMNDWISGKFSDLISFTERNVLIKLRAEFVKLFSDWFNLLVPDIFSVSLDEDFTPVIYQQGFELDYNYLSGGERTAVALAYRLALNKTINSMLSRIKTKELVILDEPTDGFSEQQLDKMRDVLDELGVQQLLIVSHEKKIESFVQNVIKLEKVRGVSVIQDS